MLPELSAKSRAGSLTASRAPDPIRTTPDAAVTTRPERRQRNGDRRQVILEASRQTLIADGYSELTLRKVAKRAHVHLKTLQHYFDNKAMLIKETTQYIADELTREYQLRSAPLVAGNDHLRAFQTIIKMMIEDCENEDNCRAFFELWALSARDRDANEAVDSLYTRNRYNLEILITCINPRLARATVSLRAALVAAQISGLTLYIGHHQPPHPELAGLKEEAIQRLTDLILRKE